jgi:hypothetical protein
MALNLMKKVTAIADAEDLLYEIQEQIRLHGILFVNGRYKNRQTLASLGIVAAQQREIIDRLQPDDYCGGPDQDEKYPWKSVSVFGTTFRGQELYIKFSVGMDNTPVVCLSFHEAERPMNYQFK